MPKIRFLCDHTVPAVDGDKYAAGDVLELNPHSVEHFVRRGLAEPVADEPPKPRKPAKLKPDLAAEAKTGDIES